MRLHPEMINKERTCLFAQDGMRKEKNKPKSSEPRQPQLHRSVHRGINQSITQKGFYI